MQHDEVIWGVINNQFCSFKSKLRKGATFCKNEYNATGLCNQSSCPLANSRYATIRENEGVCYLYMKTIERAHTPKNLWEKVKLSKNYQKALEQISQHLEFWPKLSVHRNKQRLTKIHQYLIRMRQMRKKTRPNMATINKKVERRENRREEKAKIAAKLEKSIEKELLERLQKGTYGDIYNFPEAAYNNVLEENEEDNESENESETEEPEIEFIEDFDEDESDMEDAADHMMTYSSEEENSSETDSVQPSKKRRTDRPYIEVEYEEEREQEENENQEW